MNRLFSLVMLMFISMVAFSQNDESSVSADRPGMATGTDVMPFLKVQLETGFEVSSSGSTEILLPTTMVRFGVTKFAELRLEYDGSLIQNYSKKWDYEVQPLTLGTKLTVFEGENWIPKISFLANIAIPMKKQGAIQYEHVAPSLYLLFQNDITDWFNIGYNVGAEWYGVSHVPSTFLAVCLGFSFCDNFGAFIESYNYFTRYGKKNTDVECDLDFGLTYTVHPRVQLDLYGMFNCQNPKSFNGIGFGVAWLIN
ncbi:MAG: transporter [Bacteroidales bacterium]|nr:transporter [Bacteroidales bacterium]